MEPHHVHFGRNEDPVEINPTKAVTRLDVIAPAPVEEVVEPETQAPAGVDEAPTTPVDEAVEAPTTPVDEAVDAPVEDGDPTAAAAQ